MPAQPLSSVNPKANHGFGTTTFKEYPNLAIYVAKVISFGSVMEHKWAAIFAHAMKSDLEAAMTIYKGLSGSASRLSILRGLAGLRLSVEDYELMEAVYVATRYAQRLRNDFAHHLWGYSPEIKDALLLIDPTYYPALDATAGIIEGQTFDKSKMYVYRERDLEEAVNEVHLGMLCVVEFVQSVIAADETWRNQARVKLLQRHPVAQALDNLRKKKSKQCSPPQNAETPPQKG